MPDLTVLLALILGLVQLVEGPVGVARSLLGTLACVAVGVAMSWVAAERGETAARQGRPARAVKAATLARAWPLLAWLACLGYFDWGVLVANTIPRAGWILRYLVLFVPAALLWAASWAAAGRIEASLATARGALIPPGTGAVAILQGFRRNALALLPLLFMLGFLDALWLLGEWGVPGVRTLSRWTEAVPLISVGVMLAVLAALSLLLPALLRRILSTESLPPGPTRRLLEAQASRIGLAYRDLVVWKTRGRVLNAMVVGFTPGTRTIFLTDGLLRTLPEDELLAVFSHEAGHAKRHHLPLLIGLFAIAALLFQAAGDTLIAHGLHPMWVLAAHLGVLWFVILGVVSRFFEREADVYGAEHAAALDPGAEGVVVPWLGAPLPAGALRMIRALERVRQLTGRGASHRHGTIEERVTYLARHATDPRVRTEFQRRRRRLLRITALLGLLAVAATALRLPVDLAYGRARLAYEDGIDAYHRAFDLRGEAGDTGAAGALPHWREAYAAFTRAARHADRVGEPSAEMLRARALFNRADVALHGLEDEGKAAADYRTVLDVLETADLPPEEVRPLAAQIHVDLGRIRAHAGDLAAARRHLASARARAPRPEGREGAYWRARLSLLAAAVEAAGGDAPAARRRLEGHVLKAATGTTDEWIELRRDARAALRRLLPPPPPPPPPGPEGGDGERAGFRRD